MEITGRHSDRNGDDLGLAFNRLRRHAVVSDLVWRYSVAGFTLCVGIFGAVMIFTPEGAGDSAARTITLSLLCLSGVAAAVVVSRFPITSLWWNPCPRRKMISRMFVLYADVVVSSILTLYESPAAALAGTVLFATVGAYAAHFLTTRALALHLGFSSLVIVYLGIRVIQVYGATPLAVSAQVAVSILGIGGVVVLNYLYTWQIKQLIRASLTASSTDAMTGLLNRTGFRDAVDELLRSTTGHLSVCMIDVDRFKLINDVYGHLAGDSALRAVSSALHRSASQNSLVARVGGDEFAVVSAASVHELQGILGVVRDRLPTLANGEQMSFSAGIASVELADPDALRTFDERSRFFHSVIERADESLRRSKESGGGRTTVH
ncbi:GGDEF domain-containing protein [Tsukamurella ocularis]|uniref:GGDEF domain-containing protein n=1 Tax=Tsukamurella ocularis TaxID=1970234 RepID=UPI00216A6548|nr:diguanylate cyclase [Tsukamurella ocularis]MCS3780868.1 diguanylate cyclase (GGDEF)-like protein [Tsukamurella ocularis]MCS3786692.1 diguanylate cyclase (GGDEF)-like protein [Tsukamurella ocularis]MCS3850534.1 diguanylate cyclase (GGDEF)-like protein [Tsukamurella ocularis]